MERKSLKGILTLILYWIAVNPTESYITWIATRLPLKGNPPPPGSPWPLPQKWMNSTSLLTFSLPITFTSTFSCDVVDEAKKRYVNLINKQLEGGKPVDGIKRLGAVRLQIENRTCQNSYPTQQSSETYSILINENESVIRSETIWGMLRGLETFSQLLYNDGKGGNLINETSIDDYPRFSHRGFMLDTARHFMPMNTIIKILDGMSFNKFNVFHWHVVDDQSFPYTLRKFPEMAEKGAYHPKLVYTRDDIERIKREARLRGIRVIPEFDTPGHTFSWGKSFPELLTPCWGQGRPDTPNYPRHGPREIINPTLESTFDFMRDLYVEIRDDFPDEYVHLGMDEAYYACWQSSPNVTDWMSKMNMSTYNQVEQYYSERLIEIVDKIGLKSIVWQDPLENNVTFNRETIIQVWKDKKNDANNPSVKRWQEYAQGVANLGYNFILSSPWYLNVISYGQDWRTYYEIEPTNFTTNENQKKLVKGGEACMWAEYVDGTNIHSRMWPRASAVAERLWSSEKTSDIEEAKYRLDEQRCRMISRGIQAQPLLNGHCNGNEWEGESKKEQPQQSSAYSNSYSAVLIALIIANFFSCGIISAKRK